LGEPKTTFRVKNGPCYFKKMMISVLSGITVTSCFVYLGDIVVYVRSLADHNYKLREVLDRLRKYKLKLKPDKCEFLRKEVNYLGHQFTVVGVKLGPQKVSTVETFPTPTIVKKLKTY
jgi:hypothetical protein